MSSSASVLIPDPAPSTSNMTEAAVSDWMEEDFEILAETLLDVPSTDLLSNQK